MNLVKPYNNMSLIALLIRRHYLSSALFLKHLKFVTFHSAKFTLFVIKRVPFIDF